MSIYIKTLCQYCFYLIFNILSHCINLFFLSSKLQFLYFLPIFTFIFFLCDSSFEFIYRLKKTSLFIWIGDPQTFLLHNSPKKLKRYSVMYRYAHNIYPCRVNIFFYPFKISKNKTFKRITISVKKRNNFIDTEMKQSKKQIKVLFINLKCKL